MTLSKNGRLSGIRRFYLVAGMFLTMMCLLAVPVVNALAGESNQLPPGEKPPMTVFDRITEAGSADDYDGADKVIVRDVSINYFREKGVTYVDNYMLYKILTADGAKDMSVIKWEFDPQSQFIDVQEVNIIRDGKKIAVSLTNLQELPAPQSAIYWNNRIKVLQLPRLKVGDGIEVIDKRRGFTYALLGESKASANADAPDDSKFIPPMEDEYFAIITFPGDDPIIEKKYVLMLPPRKRLHSEVYNGTLFSSTSYTQDSTIYAWWAKDLAPYPHEPRSPDKSDLVAKIVMATVESWEAKSRWFFDVNDVKNDQFAFTPAIKKKTDEILKKAGVSKGSDAEKAEALLHWVAQNIRYSGQTMGKGEGFTIHSGEMIYEQRSGVCKDIAGMLITMMRAAGLDSYAAMTMAGSRIDDVPADQFNHCVVALRKPDGSFEMYDPTWVPYNNDIWSKLETEQHYLVGTPEGEYLSRIPYSPPEESPLHVTHKAKILEDGTLEGEFTLKGSGAIDSRLRRFITGHRKFRIREYLATVLEPISDRLENITYDHHTADNFDSDMWWTIKYRVPEYAVKVGDGYEFKSPMLQLTKGHGYLFRAGATEWADERVGDVFLYYTQLIDGNEEISLPRGFEVINTGESDIVDETYASFKAKSEMKKRDFVIMEETKVKRRQIPPDGYDGFKKAIDTKHEFTDKVYRATKGGKS
ncbi:DUF3857 domain-containing transglutaminase family protein [bacterium]|nr:DUF3857 domain-containing transglutaminase family protein [bacterium]